MTCPPVLVGGADASQKGLGDWIPAKVVLREGFCLGVPGVEEFEFELFIRKYLMNCNRGPSSLGNRIYDFHSAITQIPASKYLRVSGASRLSIDSNFSFFEIQTRYLLEEVLKLRLTHG